MTPSTILRRRGSESTKNKVCFAFRELGRVIRTLFLLKYLKGPELRRTIHAATNKSEQFNDFAQWLMFGGEGVIAENVRREQRKVIKYKHLVANMVILYNIQWMSRKLKELQEKGHPVDAEVLKVLSPYRREHSTGSGTICWISYAPFHRSIRPSISHSSQLPRLRYGGLQPLKTKATGRAPWQFTRGETWPAWTIFHRAIQRSSRTPPACCLCWQC